MSVSTPMLIVARALQGIAGATLMPSTPLLEEVSTGPFAVTAGRGRTTTQARRAVR